MKIRTSMGGMLANRSMQKFVLLTVLLSTGASGCSSVIRTSENFYENIPRRPINWREYLSD